MAAQQTFPEPPPRTCVECFTAFLTAEQIAELVRLPPFSGPGSLEAECARLEGLSPELQMAELAVAMTAPHLGIDGPTIEKIIDCLERVLGLQM